MNRILDRAKLWPLCGLVLLCAGCPFLNQTMPRSHDSANFSVESELPTEQVTAKAPPQADEPR